jgi:hypothetical protein
MASGGDVVTRFTGDTSDLQRATRTAAQEMQKVGQAAEKVNTRAASGSTKAISGILRMVETGKVSAKGIDKIGKSASGLLGILSPIGVGLGLAAVPALSDGVVFAIAAIKKSLIPLSTRISDVASALGTLNQAQLDLEAANLGSIDANQNLADSLKEYSTQTALAAAATAQYVAMQKGRTVDTKKVAAEEMKYHAALRAVAAAEVSRTTAARALDTAVKKHGASSTEAANATDRLTKADIRVKGAEEKRKAAHHALNVEIEGHKSTHKELTEQVLKNADATDKAQKAALAAAHAQLQVDQATAAHDKAVQAVTQSTGEFDKKLSELTKTANANNRSIKITSGGAKVMSTDTKKAAADVSAGLRKWADSQKGLNVDVAKGARNAADLIDKTHKIPKNIATVFKQPGLDTGNKAMNVLHRLQGGIKPKIVTTVAMPGLAGANILTANVLKGLRLLDGKHVTSTVTTIFQRKNIQGPGGKGVATGGVIAGRFDARDDVPINVSRGEVILNPRQQSLVDSGMTVRQALSMTGAPTIFSGGGFAGGGWPHRKKKEKSADFHSRVVDYASGLESRTEDQWDTRLADYDAATAREQQIASRGGGSYPAARLAVRDKGAIAIINGEIRRLKKLKRIFHQHKVPTHDIDRKLHDLNQTLLDRKTDLGDAAYDVAHPAVADTATGGDTGPDPFAVQRATDAGFAAGLGRAVGYVFGGSGDIGSGGSNALNASGSVSTLHVASVVIKNTPANTTQLAAAGNSGNALVNRGRVYAPRVGTAFGR